MNRDHRDSVRLLLVDDDPAFLQVMGKALSRRAYEVLKAGDGETALELARSQQPVHAVVDLKLENESGLDLIPRLLEIRPGLNIVVLTGYASIATAVEAVKRGAANYLAKPVKADELVRTLEGEAAPEPGEEAYSPMSVERLEWEHIQRVLKEHGGNISATARSLGMYRRTLQRKLAKKPVSK